MPDSLFKQICTRQVDLKRDSNTCFLKTLPEDCSEIIIIIIVIIIIIISSSSSSSSSSSITIIIAIIIIIFAFFDSSLHAL